jgi:hypothetical protein
VKLLDQRHEPAVEARGVGGRFGSQRLIYPCLRNEAAHGFSLANTEIRILVFKRRSRVQDVRGLAAAWPCRWV